MSGLSNQDEVVRYMQNRDASQYSQGYADALEAMRDKCEEFAAQLTKLMPADKDKRQVFSSLVKPKARKRGELGRIVWAILIKSGAIGLKAVEIQKIAAKDDPSINIHNVNYWLTKFRAKDLVKNQAGVWMVLQGPKLEAYQKELETQDRKAGMSIDPASFAEAVGQEQTAH